MIKKCLIVLECYMLCSTHSMLCLEAKLKALQHDLRKFEQALVDQESEWVLGNLDIFS